MKQDRFLTGILIGIGVLIIAALAVFFVRKDSQTYVPDDVPEGVVHNYVVAVLNKDYEKAYGYLADLDNKPTYEEFRESFRDRCAQPWTIRPWMSAARILQAIMHPWKSP